jgi:PAS domain S-box-containing protein
VDGQDEFVKMVVSPVFGEQDTARGLILVVFDVAKPPGLAVPNRTVDSTQGAEPIARQLEEQVVRLKMQLRTTIEQYELQQEELKASNEELQAMNEELRSSTEELETGKEELQSVNEELSTVNQELKVKIEELSHANNDTRNLMNSTDIATVFVDRAMRIKLFTPRARTIFNLLAGDTGRPLLDITHRLEYPEIAEDIEQVLETLSPAEREVSSSDGACYIARAVPYRTGDDRIAGVVLTFTDFTRRKQAEQQLRESEEYVRLVIDSIPEFAIFTTDTAGMVVTWNPGARETFGFSDAEIIGQHVSTIFTPEDRAAGVPEKEMQQARDTGRAMDERWHLRKDGTRFYVSGVAGPLRRDGVLVGYTKIARDLTKRENADRDLREARHELETRVRDRTTELADANEALRREITERVQSEEARVKLLREVVNAQERERSRISRELHDQLGQEVTALGVKLAVLKSSVELKPETRDGIEDLEKIVKQIDGDVEFLAWELRPTGLDDLGLAEALADYVASWSRYFGVHGHLESKLRSRLPADIETVLYRIGQEALNNVAKHARAKTVTLVLAKHGNEAVLSIKDDGVGFEMGAVIGGRTLGLLGMRERAALVGGSTSIESRPRSGTTVSVRVPLDEAP